MSRGNLIYLQHILDAITRAEQYVHGLDASAFFEHTLVQDGVIRQIEIIGEAAKQLTNDLREQYPHIPWKDITGMRDKLIHHYFSVDIEAVWLTVTVDLPVFKAEVGTILQDIQRKKGD